MEKQRINLLVLTFALIFVLSAAGCGKTEPDVGKTERDAAEELPTPEVLFEPEPNDPCILYSPAGEFDFCMELFDDNWSYERPKTEGASYVISNAASPSYAYILTGRTDYDGDIGDADLLDAWNDAWGEAAFDGIPFYALERANYPVGGSPGRSLTGKLDLGSETAGVFAVSWAKTDPDSNKAYLYFIFAASETDVFEATVSEAKMLLLSFRTGDEYGKKGPVALPTGMLRGCAYDVPYSSAVCMENADGSCFLQVLLQVKNTGTVPLWVNGESSFDVTDTNGVVVASCSFALPDPDILLPGESALTVKQIPLDERPSSNELTVEAHIDVQKSENMCVRYEANDTVLRDTQKEGLELSGKIHNDGMNARDYHFIIVNLYDADHQPVGQLRSTVLKPLEPGEEGAFTARNREMPFLKAADVADYEVFIYPVQFQP